MKLCKCHAVPMWRNNSEGGYRCAVTTERRNRLCELRQERKKVINLLEELNAPE